MQSGDDFVRARNVYEAEPARLGPGIVGNAGVRSLAPGSSDEYLGVDLIDMAPGSSFPLHTHPGSHILFVLEGSGTVTVGDQTVRTRPGDSYFVPAELPHCVGATERHRLLAFGFPHRAIEDPARMHVLLGDRGGVASTGLSDVEARVVSVLDQFTSSSTSRALGLDTALDECGLDSLAIFEFVLALEKEFGMTIDDSEFTIDNFKTVGGVVAAVRRQSGVGRPA